MSPSSSVCKSTNTEAANLAKHKIDATANTFGHGYKWGNKYTEVHLWFLTEDQIL